MTSVGNPESIIQAKKTIKNALMGNTSSLTMETTLLLYMDI